VPTIQNYRGIVPAIACPNMQIGGGSSVFR